MKEFHFFFKSTVFLEEGENVGGFVFVDIVLEWSARYRVSSIDFLFSQVFLIPLNFPFILKC